MPNIDERALIWYSRPMTKKPAPPRASSKSKTAPPAPPPPSYAAKSGRRSIGAEVFGCRLPVGYLRLLDEEAAAMGNEGRRTFLWRLHERRLGRLIFERPKHFPKRTVHANELQDVKLYKWPLTPEQRQSVEAELKRSGVRQLSFYVVLLLCDWLGIPPFSPADAERLGVRDDSKVSE